MQERGPQGNETGTDTADQQEGEAPSQPDPAPSLEAALQLAKELASESSAQLRAVVKLGILEWQLSASSLQAAAWMSILFGVGLLITWSLATVTLAVPRTMAWVAAAAFIAAVYSHKRGTNAVAVQDAPRNRQRHWLQQAEPLPRGAFAGADEAPEKKLLKI